MKSVRRKDFAILCIKIMIKNTVDKCYLLSQSFGNNGESFIWGVLLQWTSDSSHCYTLIEDTNNGTITFSNYSCEEKHSLETLIGSGHNLNLSETYETLSGRVVTHVRLGVGKKDSTTSHEFIIKSSLLHAIQFYFESNEILTIYNLFDELEIHLDNLHEELPDWIEWENSDSFFFSSQKIV